MEEFVFSDLEFLNVELPEDINKRKWHGDFEGAKRLIELWLTKDVPYGMKAKLQLEKRILEILPKEYNLTYEEAFAQAKAAIPDMTKEEFAKLQDEGKIDWIYVNGKEQYFRRFLSTLLKVNPDLKQRAVVLDEVQSELDLIEHRALLHNIEQIKEKGSLGIRFVLRVSVKIEDASFQKGKVKVHLPIPAACDQISNIQILETSSDAYTIALEDALQRTICFEEEMTKNHEFFVRYAYEYRMNYQVPKEEVAVDGLEGDFTEELCEQYPHIMFTPYLRALAKQLTDGLTNPVAKARAIYDYVTMHIKYSFMREYFAIENITEYAALGQKGDCGVQALLFITLCRISGVPARWESGLYVTPYSAGSHDWAQFYAAPYGWLFADCSFGGSAFKDQDEERRQFYFGNVDLFRMPANHRFQEQFTVSKKFLRADPYDNQRGEIEYEDRGLAYDEFDAERIVEKAELI